MEEKSGEAETVVSATAASNEINEPEQKEQAKPEQNGGCSDLNQVQPNSQNNSSEQDIPLGLDNIKEKLDNPQLRQPHETEEYLKRQETSLIEKQKLEGKEKEAQKKAEYWKTKAEQEIKNSALQKWLIISGGVFFAFGIGSLSYFLIKNKKQNIRLKGGKK